MKHTLKQAKNILQEYWGHEDFRGVQAQIIESVLQQNDTLALMPTGGGKSICFQLPGLLFEGLTLVISPLIALMNDQVRQLNSKNIKAIAITSANSHREIDILLDNCIYGNIQFLYVSPERLANELFLTRLAKMPVKLIAVDEAHCISQWGYDFRPAYLNIHTIRPIFPDVPVIALTASATTAVQQDICVQLEFKKNKQVVSQSFARSNLAYVCFENETKDKRLLDILTKVKGSAIIYTRNRKQTKLLADFLQKRNITADFYHAGLTPEIRAKKQDNWINNISRVMIATNAFGMGIDKADVRMVIHVAVPESPEAYFQEAGRAGRDGKKAYSVLLWNQKDLTYLQEQFNNKYPPKEVLNTVYQRLCSILKITIGSLPPAPIPFSISQLAGQLNIPDAAFIKYLKALEWCGFIAVQYKGSARSIVTWQSSVPQAQVKAQNSKLLSFLIRNHDGFFEGPVAISEKNMAKMLAISKDEVVKQLKYFEANGWMTYESANSNASLQLLQERLSEQYFHVPPFIYNTLKKQDEYRLSFLSSFLNQEICRSKQLLEYFGEENIQPCGICDVCTNYGGSLDELNKQEFTETIEQLLKTKELNKEALQQCFKPGNQKAVQTLIRLLLDEQTIKLNNKSLLYWANNN
jgi:ATP-dependent DNA helicase RecQ